MAATFAIAPSRLRKLQFRRCDAAPRLTAHRAAAAAPWVEIDAVARVTSWRTRYRHRGELPAAQASADIVRGDPKRAGCKVDRKVTGIAALGRYGISRMRV